jgi:hypothetical protein
MAPWKLRNLFWIAAEDEESEASTEPAEAEVQPTSSAGPPSVSPVERILLSLKDIDGVVGSVAVGVDGALLGQTLPRVFPSEAATRLASRLGQMYDALHSDAGGQNPPKAGALRYRDFLLYVNPIPHGLIGVLTEERVNGPVLAMALRVVARQLETALIQR